MKHSLQSDDLNATKAKTAELSVQGPFLKLLESGNENITWKSIIYDVPSGILSWATKAITDSLATPSNLAKWKKVIDPSCKLCKQTNNVTLKGTLHHILSNCPLMLDRYQWRHDGVLDFLTSTVKMQNRDNPSTKIYADIEHHKINGGTIPSNIVPTGQRPDLLIVETLEEGTKISLVELTVPFERNIDAAIKRKTS